MENGQIQVYTGNGKGKTTAALGLALRAAGAGLRVFIAQFIKKRDCSEHIIIRKRLMDLITVRQFGEGLILKRAVAQADIDAAGKGLLEIKKAMESNEYDMFILDEANVAVHHNLVSLADLLAVIDNKPEKAELVITGRYADEKVIEKADLVTEMREIKHYKNKEIKARRGIEC
ncbi:MAG: cob(I)yrinic acid a,c-diamide adenosyltransferase [Nitrospiraceae bacterium]|nr:cob(I)yrinic acid a,c-diamide adenosyltransferase [Nitrospiraceae bacterium]